MANAELANNKEAATALRMKVTSTEAVGVAQGFSPANKNQDQ
jgi:hypothetical protein